MIALLTKLASGSLVAVKSLFELNVGSTLKAIFMDFDLPQSVQYFHMDDLRFNQVLCLGVVHILVYGTQILMMNQCCNVDDLPSVPVVVAWFIVNRDLWESSRIFDAKLD